MKNLESKLQIQCVKWFRLSYPKVLITSSAAGFAFAGDATKRKITGNKMKAMGYCVGTPDLFIAFPTNGYAGLWLEMKAGKNTPSDSQIEVMNKLENFGYKCYVCNSFDSFVAAVQGYLHGKIKPLIHE